MQNHKYLDILGQ